MIIVGNTNILNLFKKISIFKLDLGINFIDLKQETVRIKDPFMIKYIEMTGKQILTYGSIGKLIFYQDFTLPTNNFYIFNDNNVYGMTYTDDDSKMSPENYLASIVREINEKEGIKETKNTTIVSKSDPDIKLPADQYIEEMIKKRKLTGNE